MSKKRFSILNNVLSQIEENIPFKDTENPAISKATVGWHLDHTLKVFNAVCEWTINSNPKDYKWKFNYWRAILFPLGYFPRGKVKAPKYVLPPENIELEDLNTQLLAAKKYVETLKALPKSAYFKHFIFGMLPKKQTLRFLQMHTNHHLKIVKDILEK